MKNIVQDYRHISIKEYACYHCGRVPDNLHPYVVEAIVELFDTFEVVRERVGKPITITSGYRCPQHTLWLIFDEGKSHLHSPHIYGVALDLLVPEGSSKEDFVKIIREVNPDIRIGWKSYKHHVHIDTAYILKERGYSFWEEKQVEWVLKYWHRGAEW